MAEPNASTEATTTPSVEANENPAIEGSQKLFTQEQVNSLVGGARTKEREKYPNYEEYKKAYEELNDLKEAQKSDLEKATSRAEEAEQKLAEYEHKAEVATWRSEVSKETGVPAEAISGNTKEEMQSCAESLKKYFPDSSKPFISSDGNAPANLAGHATRDQFAAAVDKLL